MWMSGLATRVINRSTGNGFKVFSFRQDKKTASHFTLSVLVLRWVTSAGKREHVRYSEQATSLLLLDSLDFHLFWLSAGLVQSSVVQAVIYMYLHTGPIER